ncbi:hypothetical protein Q6A68_02305, partial [Helicobacter pylori]|nr:hypothetical protein [Helicobacter pylori]
LKEEGHKEGILEHDLTEGIELESHASFSDKYYFYQAVSEKRCRTHFAPKPRSFKPMGERL